MQDFLSINSLDDVPTNTALNAIAQLVDYASDKANAVLNDRAFEWCDKLESRGLQAAELALLDYFRSNAWATRQALYQGDRVSLWAWDQPYLQKQIYYLRRGLNNPGCATIPVLPHCQMLTNLANTLNTVGRFVEAQAYWSGALHLLPVFWMARANRGLGLMYYARALYDPGHTAVFAMHAHRDLATALRLIDGHPELGDNSLRTSIRQGATDIEREFDLAYVAEAYQPDAYALGQTDQEVSYRRWSLQQLLFLNPLNDLEPRAIAARDVLTLPDIVTAFHEPPVLIGFFNQLKQEFVSARWLYYEAVSSSIPHHSDRDVLLYNTLDCPVYGLATEKVKIAFRMAYSLFDKTAFFLNHYLQIRIPARRVSFKTIWQENDKKSVRAVFDNSENWPFRGLYWLSKDLFEPTYKDVTETDARELHSIRNHLEHKYLKVHQFTLPSDHQHGRFHLFRDTLAEAVSREDIQHKTLRLLKLARAALMYLSLGVHCEERRRRALNATTKYAVPMPLSGWEDDWKC